MSTGGVAIAYSAPSSRATGAVISAAIWNQDVVDNVIAIAAHAHTGAAGDGAGTLTVDDGSAAAPSYSNEGDTNTGIYFPAADSVGISTGGTLRTTTSSSGLAATVGVTSSHSTQGIGYATGAGGTVTQLTSKSTSVTLNKVCGQITTHNAALASAATVVFQLANSTIATGDVVVVNIADNAATDNVYRIEVTMAGSGFANLRLTNMSGGSLSEAVLINFAVIKAVTA